MEWVEVTAKTVDAARDAALDQLGVGMDEAEFDVLEEPRPGLFGRTRGEARVRARVRPTQARPKQDRRRRSRQDRNKSKNEQSSGSGDRSSGGSNGASGEAAQTRDDSTPATDAATITRDGAGAAASGDSGSGRDSGNKQNNGRNGSSSGRSRTRGQESNVSNDNGTDVVVSPDEVGSAAVTFMEGLVDAFGSQADVSVQVDGIELDVSVDGSELGLLVGPGGRTLNAVQDLARVAAQRRLGDHETRLRIDVAGYRERRQVALGEFARQVADTVRSSGESRSLEPMTSADRKVVHDVLNDEDGVTTRSVGEDPDRRIVVEPA